MRSTILVIALCGAILCVNGISTQAVDQVKQQVPLIVKDLDFAFDGGSLCFELGTIKDTEGFLLVPAPESPLRAKGRILWLPDRVGKDAVLPEDGGRALIARLLHNERPERRVHSEAAGYLVAVLAGFEPTIWGADAVDAIEKSSWLRLFEPRRENHPPSDPVDPFDS